MIIDKISYNRNNESNSSIIPYDINIMAGFALSRNYTKNSENLYRKFYKYIF